MLILTCDQIRRIDRLAVERYDMPSVLLMENAGAGAARIIHREFEYLTHRTAAIFCGPGNNGGDGFVIARHLHNAGWKVTLVLVCPPDQLKGDALINYKIVSRMPISTVSPDQTDAALDRSEVVVDALLGTGFKGEPRPPMDAIIRKINSANKKVVAVDVPSGLDCISGVPAEAAVRATLTVSFVGVKTAFLAPEAEPYVGRIEVADIGVPRELVQEVKNQP